MSFALDFESQSFCFHGTDVEFTADFYVEVDHEGIIEHIEIKNVHFGDQEIKGFEVYLDPDLYSNVLDDDMVQAAFQQTKAEFERELC